jgi:hypothetical protein
VGRRSGLAVKYVVSSDSTTTLSSRILFGVNIEHQRANAWEMSDNEVPTNPTPPNTSTSFPVPGPPGLKWPRTKVSVHGGPHQLLARHTSAHLAHQPNPHVCRNISAHQSIDVPSNQPVPFQQRASYHLRTTRVVPSQPASQQMGVVTSQSTNQQLVSCPPISTTCVSSSQHCVSSRLSPSTNNVCCPTSD